MSRIIIDDNGTTEQNPLARFKTYSYYHVLLACNTYETALLISQSKDENVLHHPQPSEYSNDYLRQYSPKKFKSKENENANALYCVLINGATDATYVIDTMSYVTATAAGAVTNDRYTSLAMEGNIIISEPKGITFLETMTQCSIAMNKDSANTVYMLKTVFVGVNDDGEHEQITDIAPIMFVITEATGTFTESGGQYKISFVSMNNGVTRLPQYVKTNKSIVFVSDNDKTPTLQSVVNNIQTQINESYTALFDCVEKQTKAFEESTGQVGKLTPSLKKVKYFIELDDFYKTYPYLSTSINHSNTGQCADGSTKTTGTDYNIESALQQMMQTCQRVQDDMNKGIAQPYARGDISFPQGTKMEYKIHTSLRTYNTSDQHAPYEITYSIVPFPKPKNLLSLDDKASSGIINKNTIEFDYIYTGRNVDILDFDMKVNVGLAYMQIATMSNSLKTQAEPTQPKVTIANIQGHLEYQERSKSATMRDQSIDIPVFFSSHIDLPTSQTSRSMESAAATVYSMTSHSSIEVQDVSMRITGNLTLLASTNISTYDDGQDKTLSTQYNKFDWGYVPSLAKVNIRMPANNDDIGLLGGEYGDNQSYTVPFWFDGHYYIAGIEHVFDQGEFTQNLQLIGLPKKEVFDAIKARETSSTNFSVNVASCFDNDTKCAPATSGSNMQTTAADQQNMITESPAGQGVIGNKPGASIPPSQFDQMIMNNYPVDNLVHYGKASADVKDAIKKAAVKTGVNEATLALIISIESEFNPKAVPRSGGTILSSARGLGQFLGGTWNSLASKVGSVKVPTDENYISDNDPRFDPYANAHATALYLKQNSPTSSPTEAYIKHHMGPTGGTNILNASGAKPMAEIFGKVAWYKKAIANNIKENETVDGYKQWVVNKLMKHTTEKLPATETTTATAPVPASSLLRQEALPYTRFIGTKAKTTANANTPECATANDKKDKKTPDNCNKDSKPRN